MRLINQIRSKIDARRARRPKGLRQLPPKRRVLRAARILIASFYGIRASFAPRHIGWGNLNRSKRWKYAGSYQAARLISPFPDRPVR